MTLPNPPRVSVIVPVYNGATTLPALLTALRGQQLTGLGEVEYLFVDNRSNDGSGEIVTTFGLANSRLLFEPVRGVSAARNRGLMNAQGDVLALIDADCVPARQWLRELVSPFFDDPQLLIAAGGLASYPPRTAAQRFAARYGLNEAGRNLLMRPPFANGRNMAVRRSAADAIGGWAVDMERGEDIDFSYRLTRQFGCTIAFRPLALALHQDRPDDASLIAQSYGYGRGLAMMYSRHPDILPWGAAQRLRRGRMTARRRIDAARKQLSLRLGRTSSADAEFAMYLHHWDIAYWRGFDAEWRALRRAAR
jgi:glycosyltransferase involved in cell wall biosynthesis